MGSSDSQESEDPFLKKEISMNKYKKNIKKMNPIIYFLLFSHCFIIPLSGTTPICPDQVPAEFTDPYSAFYLTPSGKMIMDSSTYTEEIHRFLQCEEAFILGIIPEYDALLEIGCARAERAEIIAKMDRYFYGIDINQEHIDNAQVFLRTKKIEKQATVSVFSANDLTKATFPLPPDKKTLILFPFNLLGNLQDFHLILANMIDIGQDFCFSTYKITKKVSKSRELYYSNCGCQNIRYSKTLIGDLFDSEDGLHSAAFKVSYIIDILTHLLEKKKLTATITVSDMGQLGYLIYIKRILKQRELGEFDQ